LVDATKIGAVLVEDSELVEGGSLVADTSLEKGLTVPLFAKACTAKK
jgi:hypothetical protein